MVIVYYLIVKGYGFLILAAAIVNRKAKKWIGGRVNWHQNLKNALSEASEKRIHFHCPSLGEFEQGRPVLEKLREQYPDHFICLTFFSPSGYEIRKDEPLADLVCYLPLDGPLNAYRFVNTLRPSIAFFVKYDFWHFLIRSYHRRKTPVLFISSKFRSSQLFFRWYGKFYKRILMRIDHFFVQDQSSLEILYNNSIAHVTVSGDTRFDRVYETARSAESISLVDEFTRESKVILAGSTWPPDEKLLVNIQNKIGDDWKLIIAPHEIGKSHINSLKDTFRDPVLFSEMTESDLNKRVLIIDNIGLLSSLYQYADIAYIGGGFGKGIHNILEAATFGRPVIFGPRHSKFKEAVELVHKGGAFPVKNSNEFEEIVERMITDEQLRDDAGEICKSYVDNNRGATKIIMEYVKLNFEL
jgi:3-deoxy-D-manno-octulosonic-acid transferase